MYMYMYIYISGEHIMANFDRDGNTRLHAREMRLWEGARYHLLNSRTTLQKYAAVPRRARI